ncbi:MAG: peptide ABC transporter substrate-binding protein [Candidatus Nitrohelix vancouverensis]|uniref:Peptide ABC transporter substrate-binding protein n=1 Tax=Candidatus Nitrohelix vancouverensis TaxID=2705534 RepID=A0A7T0C489_9BACT|nr:MAG: peptide ABC transporter substrate-binding protein [Candidatus Nitrohelix vancouverensis]
MIVKRILIFVPLGFTLLLLQSFFWAPTYDRQATSNPERLVKFINGSSGDAQILNPILSADTASSEINDLVFEGLLDLDDQLDYRARLASSWKQYEEAYLYVSEARLAELTGGEASPRDWREIFRRWLPGMDRWHDAILSISLQAPSVEEGSFDHVLSDAPASDENKAETVAYELRRPARFKFVLKEINQDFFIPIQKKLGEAYFDQFPYERHVLPKDTAQAPILATRYEELLPLVEHNPVIEFTLRKGVLFHDGHEFDSGDVLFTFQALMDPKSISPRRSDYEPVKSAEVMGPHKIRFVYKRLFSPAVNSWFMGILPEHLLNAAALAEEAKEVGKDPAEFSIRDSRLNRQPIGTGPFLFGEWKSDQFVRLLRNENHWEGAPEYKEYVMRIIPDPLTQEMEFYSGAVDDYSVLPHQVARLKHDPQYQNFSSLRGFYSYIGYNVRNPLFESAEIRKALGMAIDMQAIIEYVLYGEGERVSGPYPKISDWYDPSVDPLPYDLEGALAIFEREGWKRNAEGYLEKDGKIFEFNLITNNGNPIRKNILAIAQNSWKKIGVKCNTQLFEWAVFLKDFVNSLKFDAVVLGWSMGLDPDLYQLWHSSQTEPGQLNFVGYKNPEADRLIERIRKEYDKDKQIVMTHELHRMIARDQPYTFLYTAKSTRLLDKKIVIVNRDEAGGESYQKIYPTKDGRINYYFSKWRKLEQAPQFIPQG